MRNAGHRPQRTIDRLQIALLPSVPLPLPKAKFGRRAHAVKRVVPEWWHPSWLGDRSAGQGFTLVELMVTIAVAAILLLFAVPALQDFVLNNRLVAITNDLIADLALARAEAIRRGGRVTLCASNTGTSCSGGDWSAGRVVFADAGTAGSVETGVGDEILRTHPAAASGVSLVSDDTVHNDYLQFRPSGSTDASGTISFKFCDSRAKGRTVVIGLSGQVATIGEEGTTCP